MLFYVIWKSSNTKGGGPLNWDNYFLEICKAIATKSPCLSRQIGSVLVRDKSIVSTGFNGPPRGIPHCGKERVRKDEIIRTTIFKDPNLSTPQFESICPRKVLGYASGTHMELCPAQHAEENAVSNAARNGVSTIGTICYLNSVIPCSKCYGTLINAGIVEVICIDIVPYDDHTQFLINNSSIKIREFRL
jgi:dCMP deaminase